MVEELRFFDHWLRGIDNGVMREPAVTYYTYNETADRAWKFSSGWPLANERRTPFYFDAGKLGGSAPATQGETRMQVVYGVDDTSFWKSGMSFVSAPLGEDTEITGHPVAQVWLATTATDADLIARIDDLAPDGTANYVGVEGKLRASMRALADAPYENLGLPWHPGTEASRQPLQPGQPVELTFDLMPMSYLFKAGHRIRVTLQFADARATAKADPAPWVTVFHGPGAASRIILPVIPRQECLRDFRGNVPQESMHEFRGGREPGERRRARYMERMSGESPSALAFSVPARRSSSMAPMVVAPTPKPRRTVSIALCSESISTTTFSDRLLDAKAASINVRIALGRRGSTQGSRARSASVAVSGQ